VLFLAKAVISGLKDMVVIGNTIPLNSDGEELTPDGFRASWDKAKATIGIVGLTFSDLPGTAVTRLAIDECVEAEIATITGYGLKDTRSILDAF
jgi:hypothetical protein